MHCFSERGWVMATKTMVQSLLYHYSPANTVFILSSLSVASDKLDWVWGEHVQQVWHWPLEEWFITNLSLLSMSFFTGRRAVERKSKETADGSLSPAIQWFKKKASTVTLAGAMSYNTGHKLCCMRFLLSVSHLTPLLYMCCETESRSKSF